MKWTPAVILGLAMVAGGWGLALGIETGLQPPAAAPSGGAIVKDTAAKPVADLAAEKQARRGRQEGP
jgi:hypothetical protein